MKKKHTFKEWMISVRPWSFPASVMPVIVTISFLFWKGIELNWWFGLWAALNIVAFHAAGNTWSDYFDYRKKVDRDDTFGAKTITSGMFTADEIRNLSIWILAVAVAGGIGLLCLTGLPLLWIGLGGVLCTLLYPYLKYIAAGDLVILAGYAFLPAIGTSYVTAGYIDWTTMWIAVPAGLITDAILHCNNLRDIATDKRARIRTLAMTIGEKASMYLYCFEMIFPYIWVIVCSILHIFPWWALLVFLAFFPAMKNVKTMLLYRKIGAEAISTLDEKTAKLQLLFSLLITIGFATGGLLS